MMRDAQPITVEALARQLDVLRRRALSSQAGQDDLTLFATALTELATALEELQVADEELRQQAEALQTAHSEADVERRRYQELFDLAPDAYLVTDGYGKIQEANLAACRLFNVDARELVGKPLAVYVVQADKSAFYNLILTARKTNSRESGEIGLLPRGWARTGHAGRVEAEFTVVTATQIHAAGSGVRLRWIVRDIASRKQAEAVVQHSREQMQMFAAGVEAAREAERRRIARELHDELGQTLTGLKMSLGLIKSDLPAEPSLLSSLDQMDAQLNGTIQSVRRIMNDLRPIMLDDLGLVATLEWQCRDFESRTGIRCRFRSNVDEVSQTKDRATTLFRLVQEILTNVARHANASHVYLTLKQTKHALRLEARDNGRGITESQANSIHSAGVLGMRERVHLLDGSIEFVGEPDKGTTIRIQVPCTATSAATER